MKILVLGSSGQIGSEVCKFLLENGHTVFTWDIKDSQDQDLTKHNPKLLDTMKESDFVYYFASDVGGAKYLEKYQDSYQFIYNNITMMNNVFSALKEANKPFIFTSSQMADIKESTYGTLKIVGEKLSKSINGLSIRLWNVYGKESYEEKSHVITDFIHMAKTQGIIKVRTDGRESRQFLAAEDLYNCLIFLTQNFNSLDKDKNYHITSFNWTSIREIANIISEISGCKIEYGEKKDQTQMNYMNEPDKYILNFWQPLIKIQDGIKNLYQQYKD